MAQVAPIPTGERPVLHTLRIHHHLDEHIEQRDDLERA
jgi:hypothetical protein